MRVADYLEQARAAAARIKGPVTVMEVCGGHTNLILRYGLRSILPKNIRLISGPGCPVCVTPQRDIDCAVRLAQKGIPIATYGDMLRVPGTRGSLDDARAAGATVLEVYTATEVLDYRQKYPDMIFFGVGFETTAPMSAFLLEHRVPVFSAHRRIAPAIEHLAGSVDGFLNPGHVSSIIGTEQYTHIRAPQAIAGFTPPLLLRALAALLEMIADNRTGVVNTYPEAVKQEGNPAALKSLEKHFSLCDSYWRGLGLLPESGLQVRRPALDARKIHEHLLQGLPKLKVTGCRCEDVLKGARSPKDCRLFAKQCTPASPVGACMVSREGSCGIHYHYERDISG